MGDRRLHPGPPAKSARLAPQSSRVSARGDPLMATHHTDELIPALATIQRRLLACGAIGLVVTAIAGFFNPTQFFESYLIGYMWCLGVTLGCLAMMMVHQLTGGAWGLVIRGPMDAAARVLPLMTLLF